MSAVPDDKAAEKLARLRSALLRKAEENFRVLRQAAEMLDVEALEAAFEGLKSVIQVVEFPEDLRRSLRPAAEAAVRDALTRAVEGALVGAEERGRDGDAKGRNEKLNEAKALFVKALRFGAGDDFRAAVDKRVQTCLMTSAAGVDDRTKAAAARKLEERDRHAAKTGREKRRAVRYVDPPLKVEIDGKVYDTIDWSQLGVSVRGWTGKPALKKGDKVRIILSHPEVSVSGRQVGRVVRADTGDRGLAIEFSDISTLVLDLISAMRRIGLAPRWQ